MALDIKTALSSLDVTNDGQWTSDGLPRLDALKTMTGDATLTRDAVNAALPGFTRTGTVAPSATQPWAPNAAPATPAAAAPLVAAPTTVAPAPPVAPVAPKVTTPPPVLTGEVLGDAIEAAHVELDLANKNLAEIDSYLAEGNAARALALKAVDVAAKRVETLVPKETTSDAIQDYLASQRALLADRARRIGVAKAIEKDIGVKLKELIPTRAPIDSAYARRNGRGSGRTYAPKK